MFGRKIKILLVSVVILFLFENAVYALNWITEENRYIPQLIEWSNSIIYHMISYLGFILMIIEIVLLISKGMKIKNKYSYMIASIILFLLIKIIEIMNGGYSYCYYTQIGNEPSKVKMIEVLIILIGIIIIQLTLLAHIIQLTNRRGNANACKEKNNKIN